MTLRQPASSIRRRIVMPLVILLIAVAIWMWYEAKQSRDAEDIRQYVRSICQDAARGQPIAARISSTGSRAVEEIERQIQSICASQPNMTKLEIEVLAGDAEAMGLTQGDATHRAILRDGHRPLLGLRVHHPGDANRIAIIGSFAPD